MLSVLRQPQPRRFYIAHLQSQLGTGAAYVALVLIAYERLHQGWAIALVLLADVVPSVVLSAPFGALADRVGRTRLAVLAELLRAVAFLGLAAVSSFAATVGLALVAGVGTALFNPAVSAALPDLVPQDQRSSATALYSAIANLGLTAGPALTALVLLVGTPEFVLAVNGVSFLASAALLSRVRLGRAAAPVEDANMPGPEKARPASEAPRGAVTADGRQRQVSVLLAFGAASVFAGAVINVAEPILATGALHGGKAGYSLLVALYGTGMVTGSLLCSRAGARVSRLRWLWLVGNALFAVGLLGSAAAPSLAFAAGTFALTGLANALIVSPELRLFQELVPGQFLGRVFGRRDALQNGAVLAAFLSAGVLLSVLGARACFALGGLALLALTGLAALAFAPRTRTAPAAIKAFAREPHGGTSPVVRTD